jgi:hypothetical protein|tara:strand:- start:189 stop:371 length:183 start_codon:yes stop_codon:yes gene_type:complete
LQRELNTRERSSGGPGKKGSKSNLKINKPQARMDDIDGAEVEVPDDFEVNLDIGLPRSSE